MDVSKDSSLAAHVSVKDAARFEKVFEERIKEVKDKTKSQKKSQRSKASLTDM